MTVSLCTAKMPQCTARHEQCPLTDDRKWSGSQQLMNSLQYPAMSSLQGKITTDLYQLMEK